MAIKSSAKSAAPAKDNSALEARIAELEKDLAALAKKCAALQKQCDEASSKPAAAPSGNFVTREEWRKVNNQIARGAHLRLKY